MWREHWFAGVGLKEFAAYRDRYAPISLASGSDVADAVLGFQREPLLSPHNMYLLVLSEQGLLGFLAMTGLLLAIAVMTVRRTWSVRPGDGPPDGQQPDGRLVSVVAVGTITTTLVGLRLQRCRRAVHHSDVGPARSLALVGRATVADPGREGLDMSDQAAATSGLIVRAAVLTTVLTVLGSLLGLLRDLLLARFFGATASTDAFLVAWTVPEAATPLLIDGAMAFLMVPIFVRALTEHTSLAAVIRATLPRVAALLALAAIVVALGAPILVHLLAPGLADPDLAIRCTRITAVTVLTFGLAGYLGAALRSRHRFGAAAAIYVTYNVGILTAMTLLHGRSARERCHRGRVGKRADGARPAAEFPATARTGPSACWRARRSRWAPSFRSPSSR